MAKHDGKAEIDGVRYVLSEQPQHIAAAKRGSCDGCVAKGNARLCDRLPQSCLACDTIWLAVK